MISFIAKKADKLKRLVHNLDPQRLLQFITHLCAVVFLTFITPFIIRGLFAYHVVDQKVPLDFVFQTCTTDYYGVCSFPEAKIDLAEQNLILQSKMYYDFTIDLELIETESLMSSKVFLTQLEVKDNLFQPLGTLQRSVNLQYSFLYRWFIKIRNLTFFPLYLVGMLSSSSPTEFHITFPRSYQLKSNETANFLVVQVQSRLAQIKYAQLHIEANTSYFTYFLSYYTITSFIFLAVISCTIYSTLMVIYWTMIGVNAYNQMPKLEEDATFSKPLNIKNDTKNGKILFDPRTIEEKFKDLSHEDLPECPKVHGVYGWDVKPTGGQRIGFD
ncbi:unnamed protein product [Bursaphelenchus okinawaensis]|uniref:Seipin n=1 Tax=Bursaphelenchus okinawaensis TaxID=465554 RepID=A0A811LGT9_9BILA|nr:unnamed protein product [Bursaphelenchus okinawaensis]CAG9122131.1 unnamed protein product [Bursaphelenchus okinawaensis]